MPLLPLLIMQELPDSLSTDSDSEEEEEENDCTWNKLPIRKRFFVNDIICRKTFKENAGCSEANSTNATKTTFKIEFGRILYPEKLTSHQNLERILRNGFHKKCTVLWIDSGVEEIIRVDDENIFLTERDFKLGMNVSRGNYYQSGKIVGMQTLATVKILENQRVISDIPLSSLKPIYKASVGDYVMKNEWLGVVTHLNHCASLRLHKDSGIEVSSECSECLYKWREDASGTVENSLETSTFFGSPKNVLDIKLSSQIKYVGQKISLQNSQEFWKPVEFYSQKLSFIFGEKWRSFCCQSFTCAIVQKIDTTLTVLWFYQTPTDFHEQTAKPPSELDEDEDNYNDAFINITQVLNTKFEELTLHSSVNANGSLFKLKISEDKNWGHYSSTEEWAETLWEKFKSRVTLNMKSLYSDSRESLTEDNINTLVNGNEMIVNRDRIPQTQMKINERSLEETEKDEEQKLESKKPKLSVLYDNKMTYGDKQDSISELNLSMWKNLGLKKDEDLLGKTVTVQVLETRSWLTVRWSGSNRIEYHPSTDYVPVLLPMENFNCSFDCLKNETMSMPMSMDQGEGISCERTVKNDGECLPSSFPLSTGTLVTFSSKFKDKPNPSRHYGVITKLCAKSHAAQVRWYQRQSSGLFGSPKLMGESMSFPWDLDVHPLYNLTPGSIVIGNELGDDFEDDDSSYKQGGIIIGIFKDTDPNDGMYNIILRSGVNYKCWPDAVFKCPLAAFYDCRKGHHPTEITVAKGKGNHSEKFHTDTGSWLIDKSGIASSHRQTLPKFLNKNKTKFSPPLHLLQGGLYLHTGFGFKSRSKFLSKSSCKLPASTAIGISFPFSKLPIVNIPRDSNSISSSNSRLNSNNILKECCLLNGGKMPGIWIKGFEGRQDLFSVMMEGQNFTPYEDALFFFTIKITQGFPTEPPLVHYQSYSNSQLNPCLKLNGTVCLPLLNTYPKLYDHSQENWDPDESSIGLVLMCIQKLVLCSIPFDKDPSLNILKMVSTAYSKSVCLEKNLHYLEQVIQSIHKQLRNLPNGWKDEVLDYYRCHIPKLFNRLMSRLFAEKQTPVEFNDLPLPQNIPVKTLEKLKRELLNLIYCYNETILIKC